MTLTREKRDNNAATRIYVYKKFEHEELDPPRLASLLGYKNYQDMRRNFTAQNISTCNALLGPYGHTIYKMLVLRSEDKQFQQNGEERNFWLFAAFGRVSMGTLWPDL